MITEEELAACEKAVADWIAESSGPFFSAGRRAAGERRDSLAMQYFHALAKTARVALQTTTPRPRSTWHEDFGDVLWWRFPIEEPPYVGSPLDDRWPGHHTHWTPIPIPEAP